MRKLLQHFRRLASALPFSQQIGADTGRGGGVRFLRFSSYNLAVCLRRATHARLLGATERLDFYPLGFSHVLFFCPAYDVRWCGVLGSRVARGWREEEVIVVL